MKMAEKNRTIAKCHLRHEAEAKITVDRTKGILMIESNVFKAELLNKVDSLDLVSVELEGMPGKTINVIIE